MAKTTELDAIAGPLAGDELLDVVEDPTGTPVSKSCTQEVLVRDRIRRLTSADSPYTVLATDQVLVCDTSGGAITLALPAGVAGKRYRAVNAGSAGNDVTVDGDGAETVRGAVTLVLTDGQQATLHYEATAGWW